MEEAAHRRAQKEINAHATLWVRMMKVGENSSMSASRGLHRVKDSMMVHNHGLAPLYSLRKDHKVIEDGAQGPQLGLYVEAVRLTIMRCRISWG